MSKTMMLAPPITQGGMPGFLLWARRDNPALYKALQREFPPVAHFEQGIVADQGLGGIADILKSVGSSLTKSASAIGSFVAKNALPIATAAVPLIVAKKQADVANAQVKLAQAQQQPMQTAVQYDAQGNAWAVPVRQTLSASDQATLNEAGMSVTPIQQMSANARNLVGFSLSTRLLGVPLWGWAAGVGTLGLVMILRRR